MAKEGKKSSTTGAGGGKKSSTSGGGKKSITTGGAKKTSTSGNLSDKFDCSGLTQAQINELNDSRNSGMADTKQGRDAVKEQINIWRGRNEATAAITTGGIHARTASEAVAQAKAQGKSDAEANAIGNAFGVYDMSMKSEKAKDMFSSGGNYDITDSSMAHYIGNRAEALRTGGISNGSFMFDNKESNKFDSYLKDVNKEAKDLESYVKNYQSKFDTNSVEFKLLERAYDKATTVKEAAQQIRDEFNRVRGEVIRTENDVFQTVVSIEADKLNVTAFDTKGNIYNRNKFKDLKSTIMNYTNNSDIFNKASRHYQNYLDAASISLLCDTLNADVKDVLAGLDGRVLDLETNKLLSDMDNDKATRSILGEVALRDIWYEFLLLPIAPEDGRDKYDEGSLHGEGIIDAAVGEGLGQFLNYGTNKHSWFLDQDFIDYCNNFRTSTPSSKQLFKNQIDYHINDVNNRNANAAGYAAAWIVDTLIDGYNANLEYKNKVSRGELTVAEANASMLGENLGNAIINGLEGYYGAVGGGLTLTKDSATLGGILSSGATGTKAATILNSTGTILSSAMVAVIAAIELDYMSYAMSNDYFGSDNNIQGLSDLTGEYLRSIYNNSTLANKEASAEMDLYMAKLEAGLISPDTPFTPSDPTHTPTLLEGAKDGLTDFYGKDGIVESNVDYFMSLFDEKGANAKITSAEIDLYNAKIAAGEISPDTPFKPSNPVHYPTILEGAKDGLNDAYGIGSPLYQTLENVCESVNAVEVHDKLGTEFDALSAKLDERSNPGTSYYAMSNKSDSKSSLLDNRDNPFPDVDITTILNNKS